MEKHGERVAGEIEARLKETINEKDTSFMQEKMSWRELSTSLILMTSLKLNSNSAKGEFRGIELPTIRPSSIPEGCAIVSTANSILDCN